MVKRHDATSAEVGMASRIAVVVTRDGYKLRGKITLSFMRPLPEEVADRATQFCEKVIAHRLRDEISGGELPLTEDALVGWVESQLPSGFPRVKLIRIHALHVVGVMSGSGTMQAAVIPAVAQSSPAHDTGAGPASRPGPASSPGRSSPGRSALGAAPPPLESRIRPVAPASPTAAAIAGMPRTSSAAARVRWIRRRSVWTQELGRLSANESMDRIVSPLAFAVRDMAARLTTATLLALDHESFDLFGALEGRAHLEMLSRLRTEAGAAAIARLAFAMGQANVPGVRAASILNGLNATLDPRGRLMKELPRYLSAEDVSLTFSEAISHVSGGQDVAGLMFQLRPVFYAIEEDVRTQAAFLRRWGGQ